MSVGKRALVLASVASMIEQFNLPTIRLLQQLGYEVHVACNFTEGNTCDEACIRRLKVTLQGLGVPWYQWDCPRSIYIAHKCIIAYFQLCELTKCHFFDIIHCHSPIGGALARIVGHQRGIPVIYTAHGFHFYQGAPLQNWLLYYPAEKLFAHWTDVLVTVNREDYVFARRNLPAKKIYRIPGVGVDTKRFGAGRWIGAEDDAGSAFRELYRIPQDAILLLSVGELNKGKNHREVLEALSMLHSKNRRDKSKNHRADVYYLICGQGKLQGWLARYAKRLGIGARVRLPGYVEDIAAAYQAANIFVFPSRREGMPVALMEAMAAGLPCVASDIRGNRELIADWRPGKHDNRFHSYAGGRLFRLGQTWELADALDELIQSKELRESCGSYNKRQSKKYDLMVVEERMRRIYQDLLYPRAQNSSTFIDARGHIRATALANHSAREYKKRV